MVIKFRRFIRGLMFNGYGKAGVILVTSAFITFVFLEFFSLVGLYTNAYFGLITYLALPLLFLLGLLLIPIGWLKYKKSTGKSTRELLSAAFSEDEVQPGFSGSKVFSLFLVLTAVNVIFMVVAGMRTIHFMDSSYFCGNACHSVMHPEWETYQSSPHARVPCVDCHVGEGIGALVDSKLNGVWQMISASFNLYQRPIPTPVHRLRPARETCEKCHWPEQFYGNRLKQITRFEPDSSNTRTFTTLALKIDEGKNADTGIHWHISNDQVIRYTSVNDEREEIIQVVVEYSDGSENVFRNQRLIHHSVREEVFRTMDCVDCHNRATHIYQDPRDAVDEYLGSGMISTELPYIRSKAVSVLTANYPNKNSAMNGLEKRLRGFYARQPGTENLLFIDQAAEACQEIYNRNIHPEMNVGWNPYPNHIGHRNNGGCFRCHNEDMIDERGRAIVNDCTVCHSILAWDSPQPFQFLQPVDSSSADIQMHLYLQKEFFSSSLEN